MGKRVKSGIVAGVAAVAMSVPAVSLAVGSPNGHASCNSKTHGKHNGFTNGQHTGRGNGNHCGFS